MKKEKILLGLPENNSLDKICDMITEIFLSRGMDVEITRKYSKLGILQFLEKNSEYRTLITQEHLEMSRPYDVKELDELTDKFSNLNIIIIISDEHYKTSFMQQLFNLNIYNAVFDKDAYIENLVNLAVTKRSKLNTKCYYGIDTSNDIKQESVNYLVSQDQLDSIISYLSKSDIEDLYSNYEYIISKYDDKQNVYICSKLTDELKEKLKDNHNFKKYDVLVDNKKIKLKPHKSSKSKESTKKEQQKDIIKFIREVEVASSDTKSDSDRKKLVFGILGVEKGVGATNVSVNLSYTLAKKKINTSIIDLDLKDRDIYYHFNKNYEGCLSKLNQTKDFNNIGQIVGDNLVCFSEYWKQDLQIDKNNILNLISYAKRKYEATILDININTLPEETVRAILQQCDKILIVLDQQSNILDRVASNLNLYQAYIGPADLVINKYDNIKYFTEKYIMNYFKQENFFIEIGYCFTIANDNRMIKALATREQAVELSQELKKDFNKIAETYYTSKKKKKFKFFLGG
ncbi:hypothetical protein [Vallitalea guaymasensis]|uniref:hypothetical protein n=1 Tax=Vallitalea guaymasensis TaxID=1185412 RepID=UPI000DE2A2B6|nr:hypothetical protein [Vallitalea guaymasensis]